MISKTYPKVAKNSTLSSKAGSPQVAKSQAQNGLKNVNAKAGPRTGNAGSMAKRNDFIAIKNSAAPIADMINDAYKARGEYRKEKFAPGEGAIKQDVAPLRRGR
jgi:hypothetical protein